MSDPLQPSVSALLDAWRSRVGADKAQVDRCREVADPTDFYAPVKDRFRMDPRRTDDETLNALVALAKPEDVWLDVGAGGGRYALPLALQVREVIAIDPSPSMLGALAEDAAAAGIGNIKVIEARWPMAAPPKGNVVLAAHVGYDIGEIGPFVDQLETQASRLCVAVLGESAMQTTAALFWQGVHGEPRVRLPALPEFLMLLTARRRLPEVTLVDRSPPTFASTEEAIAMARRQLWLEEGSAKDRKLRRLVEKTLTERDGRYAFEWTPTKIGIVSWADTLMADVSIRPADPIRDARRTAEIYAPAVASITSFEEVPPTADEIAARMAAVLARTPWLVAETADGLVVGYAYASEHRTRASYRWSVDISVYVDPAFHGRGIGRALYEELLPILRRQRFVNAYAGIGLPNTRSVALHEAIGMKRIGVYERVGWKLGRWVDVAWYGLRLTDPPADSPPPEPIPLPQLPIEGSTTGA